jgi:O-methyltransferase
MGQRTHDVKVAADHVRRALLHPRGYARRTAWRLRLAALHRREYALFRKYRDRSMVPLGRFIDNLLLAERFVVDGAIVECGSLQGGISAAIAEVLPGHTAYLLDSFEGLPDSGSKESLKDQQLLAQCRPKLIADEEIAYDTMRRQANPFVVRRGWFKDTVPKLEADPIALLRLDGDLYESTMVCLTHLFPRVPVGGLIIIDDYGDWDGCTRAVHDYLAREDREEAIRRTPRRVPYIVKR